MCLVFLVHSRLGCKTTMPFNRLHIESAAALASCSFVPFGSTMAYPSSCDVRFGSSMAYPPSYGAFAVRRQLNKTLACCPMRTQTWRRLVARREGGRRGDLGFFCSLPPLSPPPLPFPLPPLPADPSPSPPPAPFAFVSIAKAITRPVNYIEAVESTSK